MIPSSLLLYICCILMLHLKIACVVLPDYCFHELNTSDCDVTPTPVFYFYKPGSRCELDIWRGCPTFNKFENEVECSITCIYRFPSSVENYIKYSAQSDSSNLVLDVDWEDEMKKIPSDDAVKLHDILNKFLKNRTVTPSPPPTNETTDALQTTPALTDATVAGTTKNVTAEMTVTPGKKSTPTETMETTVIITPTTSTTVATDLVTTDKNDVTTVDVVTTDNEVTTDSVTAKQLSVVTTKEPATEVITTVPVTTTTVKGHPEEVIVMK